MFWFTIATLTPVGLLAMAAFGGGLWAVLALGYMTLFVFFADRLPQTDAMRRARDGAVPLGHRLSELLGWAHMALIFWAVMAVSGANGLPIGERILCFFAFGMFFGQVSNSNAHELIHRCHREARHLGKLVYISLLFGHHASAHTLVHHVHAATDLDSNSPRGQESFYHFAPRAWALSFVKGWRAETRLRARAQTPPALWTHPYVAYLAGAFAMCVGMVWLFSWAGLLAFLLIAFYAQTQLLLSDYVQHYGLKRGRGADGRYLPIGPGHSWNSPHFYSSALMLNATRHSDHHMHPSRSYPALQLDRDQMAILPYSLPMMATLALWPRRWRRVMARAMHAQGIPTG